MKKNIVIIGANDFQNQLILRAKEMGFITHVFAWQCGDIGERTADYFYPVSIVENERILEICRAIDPVGVVSIASDLANITVNYVSQGLGLTCNGMDSALVSTNKHRMRQAFERAGLPSCKSRLVSDAEDALSSGMSFPVIIKPTDRSGSRGIFKVTESSQLPSAIAQARAHSFEKKVLMEEFAEGREYSIEYVSWQGEHHFLACTEKFTTGAPLFVENGHLEPAFHITPELLGKIKDLVPKVLDCLGVKFGASHTELKIDDAGNIRLIECGSRMGGDCIGSDLVYLSTGIDYVTAVTDIACGKAPDLTPAFPGRVAAVRFIFNARDLENLAYIKSRYPEAIYRVSDILPIDGREISDSSTRYGYYILVSDSPEEMQEILSHLDV